MSGIPPSIARARLVTGILLVVTVVAVIVALVLGINWYMDRPVSL